MSTVLKNNRTILDWFYAPQSALVAALFRIATGTIFLLTVSLFGFYLQEFFSSSGYVTKEIARTLESSGGGGNGWSIFFYYDPYWFVAVLYSLMIISGFCYVFGVFSRPAAFICYLLNMSFYNRFPAIGFGGSEILFMTLFFASFLQTDRRLIPSWYAKLRGWNKKVLWVPGWSARLIQVNFAIIYLFASITKLTHQPWLDGYEIVGIVNSYYGTLPMYWMANYPIVAAFMVYSSMAIELSIPYLVWFNQTRLFIVLAAIAMHAGISLMINVTYFSEVMISGLLIFLHPRDFITIRTIITYMKKNLLKPAFFLIAVILFCNIVWFVGGRAMFWSFQNNGCPENYIWVPGNEKYETQNGFCVMKYEAKRGDSKAISIPQTQPWVSISRDDAAIACKAQGEGYDLISDKEWLTIAYNVSQTPINDISPEAGLQLPVGNISGVNKSLGAKPIDDPYTWGCDLTKPLFDQTNRYRWNICELRGKQGNLFFEKGYSGTNQFFARLAKKYDAGKTADRARLRTMVLSNGSVIWDFSANVWEWVQSPLVIERKTGQGTAQGEDSDGITDELPLPKENPKKTFFHFYDEIVDWKKLEYLKPDFGLKCANGIGKMYLDPGESWGAVNEETKSQKAFIRGGAWANPTEAGILALNISHAPTDKQAYIGFRCVKHLK